MDHFRDIRQHSCSYSVLPRAYNREACLHARDDQETMSSHAWSLFPKSGLSNVSLMTIFAIDQDSMSLIRQRISRIIHQPSRTAS